MASATSSGEGPLVLPDMEQSDRAEGVAYSEWVSQFVSVNRHKSLVLHSPAGFKVQIGELSDTVYKDDHHELREWGTSFLPHKVTMQVVGFVEGGCTDYILMTCEDKKLYIFDGEELHEVASSVEQLLQKQIEYPATKIYNRGDAYSHMTDEEWKKTRKTDSQRRFEEKMGKRFEEQFLKRCQELVRNEKEPQ